MAGWEYAEIRCLLDTADARQPSLDIIVYRPSGLRITQKSDVDLRREIGGDGNVWHYGRVLLASMGVEGWELVPCTIAGSFAKFFLKRPSGDAPGTGTEGSAALALVRAAHETGETTLGPPPHTSTARWSARGCLVLTMVAGTPGAVMAARHKDGRRR